MLVVWSMELVVECVVLMSWRVLLDDSHYGVRCSGCQGKQFDPDIDGVVNGYAAHYTEEGAGFGSIVEAQRCAGLMVGGLNLVGQAVVLQFDHRHDVGHVWYDE